MKRVLSTLLLGLAVTGGTFVATAPGAAAEPAPPTPVSVTVDGPADGAGVQVDVGIDTDRLQGTVAIDTGNGDGPLISVSREHGSW
jgi:hypothetical protein